MQKALSPKLIPTESEFNHNNFGRKSVKEEEICKKQTFLQNIKQIYECEGIKGLIPFFFLCKNQYFS